MQVLFTPWRFAYISRPGPDLDCFLCAAAAAPDDDERLVVATAAHHVVLLNRHPYSNGHLMIAPRRHLASPQESSASERAELWPLVLRAQRTLSNAYAPGGFNLGLNLGSCAGAGLPGHFHFHVVPRWQGDTNFMSALADTRLVPEGFDSTLPRLRRLFAETP